jgi:hypothetical protein
LAVGKKLEGLCVAHRPPFYIYLCGMSASDSANPSLPDCRHIREVLRSRSPGYHLADCLAARRLSRLDARLSGRGGPTPAVSIACACVMCAKCCFVRTLSFSTIAPVPWHGDASNVSMESSRFIYTSDHLLCYVARRGSVRRGGRVGYDPRRSSCSSTRQTALRVC